MSSSIPHRRTCIGCRQRDAAAEMVRIWLRPQGGQGGKDAEVVVAGAARSGRGASLHARPGCLETGLRPDVLARAFKRRVTVRDATELLQQITIASRRKR
jgi:predicted RNA-binding protein YlxR (DUF448 family)